MSRTKILIVAVFACAVVAMALFVVGIPQKILLGETRIDAPDIAVAKPAPGAFSHKALDTILKGYVDDQGRVKYRSLAKDERLGDYVASLAAYSPDNAPELFPTDADKLTYYCNAYNALVLWGVLRHWPISSVQDVEGDGWISVKAGQGFFYSLKFNLGGEWINLYDLENTIIRGFNDARIHAAINCASGGCPKLAPFAFEPQKMDAQFDEVMRGMVAEDRNASVDDASKTIKASSIFDWFRDDFGGDDAAIIDYLIRFADPEKAKAIRAAKDAGHTLTFVPYDWSLNDQS